MKIVYSVIWGFLLLLSTAFAAEDRCSNVDVIKNSNGDIGLTWESPSSELLKSWRVEFTLSGNYVTVGDIFWTFYSASSDVRKKGITLSVTEELQLLISHDGCIVATSVPWLISGNSYTMAFQFVLFENAAGIAQKGEFAVVSGEKILSYVIEDTGAYEFCAFRKSYDNSKVTRFQNMAGAYDYSDVSLYYLSSRIIPEPSTTVLLIGSLVLLCLRRRR